MTETYTGQTIADDIEDAVDTPATRLDREADAILQRDEMRSFGVRPIRKAIREDARAVGDWGRSRAGKLRHTVEEEPVRYALYALGIGVLIGLLAAR
ncbi:hypothetical protein [Brevundimonas sp. M20]|uniref:hypothetical protein n=1 Tax=Brevundimonas sp. M20 TaxID=2591463 RepID=UPI001147A176|nr:hypothetical protein [Brevundimonas sp. M20]QDH73077.1 hypothetical protein FKQ52_06345 [Brevundimonas sp. M20]